MLNSIRDIPESFAGISASITFLYSGRSGLSGAPFYDYFQKGEELQKDDFFPDCIINCRLLVSYVWFGVKVVCLWQGSMEQWL